MGKAQHSKGLGEATCSSLAASGHAKKVVDGVKAIDSAIVQNNYSSVVNAIGTTKFGSSKTAKALVKTSRVASTVINPLLVGIGATRILQANEAEKPKVAVEESAALIGLFGTESLAKKAPALKLKAKIVDKLAQILPKRFKWIEPVVDGLVAISASIGGSHMGREAGKTITSKEA